MQKINIFWFRHDLRLEDNTGLIHALSSGLPVLPVYIFDPEVLKMYEPDDKKLSFVIESVTRLNNKLNTLGSGVRTYVNDPEQVFSLIMEQYDVNTVYGNEEYEPASISRDSRIKAFLVKKGIRLNLSQDRLINSQDNILKSDGTPYLVFTPYFRKWNDYLQVSKFRSGNYSGLFVQGVFLPPPSAEELGFKRARIEIASYHDILLRIPDYNDSRNFPSIPSTGLSPLIRFGLISIRQIIADAFSVSPVLIKELAWREFFHQVLYHFPHAWRENYRREYDVITWRNNEDDFSRWMEGCTGYPIVDAGMRELNQTGFMHNRVRMIVASFLTKHLLIDWRWGEAYFASKLLDYDAAVNNGNWQWAAGTGCDASPYFRVFNPSEQQKRFDPENIYIKRWVPEVNSSSYPEPMVDHQFARLRALAVYRSALKGR